MALWSLQVREQAREGRASSCVLLRGRGTKQHKQAHTVLQHTCVRGRLSPLHDSEEEEECLDWCCACPYLGLCCAAVCCGCPAGVLASNHQHLFCVRIDPAVDDAQGGKSLVVSEVNAEQLPWGPDNPHGASC